jgi:hypothetical protein
MTISRYRAQKKAFQMKDLLFGRLVGIEPTTSGTTNLRSNRLSYNRHISDGKLTNNLLSVQC